MQETPEVQRELRSLLQEIWSIFRKAETVNPREIVATLATLMTEGKTSAFPEEMRPCKPRNRYNVDNDILPLLKEVYKRIDAATFFDRYILFYDELKDGDNAYPIPRHITDFIIQLLRIQPQHHFADFTCGTGGFLVNTYRGNNLWKGDTVGIEISPDWIRLAVANAILHDIPPDHLHFYTKNALRACYTDPELKSHNFDRIAIAPPFGQGSDEELIRLWRQEKNGGNSNEDVFTRMVLQKLADGGLASIIVPASLTAKERGGMPKLRNLLVRDYTILAVISLPDDALAPFASRPVCLLLLANMQPYAEQSIWFFRARKDGYSAELNRDLLVAPDLTPEHNDLFLIQQSLKRDDAPLNLIITDTLLDTGITFAQVIRENAGVSNELHGVIIHVAKQTTLHMIKLFPMTKDGTPQHNVLLTASWQVQKQDVVCYIFLPLNTKIPDPRMVSTFTQRTDADDYIRSLYGLKKDEDIPRGMLISRESLSGQKIVLAQDGSLLGITQPHSRLMEKDHILQPEQYLPKPEVLFSTDSPVKLLSKLQQDQALIEHYVDNLLGQLEINAIDSNHLPPPLDSEAEKLLIDLLGPEQHAIWDLIDQQMQTKPEVGKEERYALYFSPDQLLKLNELADLKIDRLQLQQALDLFARMGLLVRVFVTPPNEKERFPCYRRVTVRDKIHLPERLNA